MNGAEHTLYFNQLQFINIWRAIVPLISTLSTGRQRRSTQSRDLWTEIEWKFAPAPIQPKKTGGGGEKKTCTGKNGTKSIQEKMAPNLHTGNSLQQIKCAKSTQKIKCFKYTLEINCIKSTQGINCTKYAQEINK